MTQRDNTFDVMKGIGILAMIVGHSPIPELLNRFIFVWHMPLFFLVSGYFFKPKPVGEYMRRNARQLILPYAVTSLLMILLTAAKQLTTGKGDTLTMAIAALVGNGTLNNPTFSEYNIGAIWFLLAMFWCRSVYNVMYARITDFRVFGGEVLAVSSIATYVGTMVYMPTDSLEGLQALLFFHVGHIARQNNLQEISINWWFIALVAVLTGFSIHAGSMSMVRCYYGYWPVNCLAAIGMTIVIFHLSRRLKDNRFLIWCGRVSMVILCVHITELTFFPLKTIHEVFVLPLFSDVIIHLSISLLATYLILKLRIMKSIFSIRGYLS